MGDRQERVMSALELAGGLLPELVEWIQAMRAAGAGDDDIRRDIRDRTEAVRANRAEVDDAIDDKFGRVQAGDDDGRA